MQNATYTIKIKDLLAVADERKRWILVKKALAANVGAESTRAIEFGYVDLAHASERLRLMMEEQSETMTLPLGLEPVDPSDGDRETRMLLNAWAREVAVKPSMRIPSRKARNRPLAPVVEEAVENAVVESVPAVAEAIAETRVDEPLVETTPEETTVEIPAETVAAGEAESDSEGPVNYPFVQQAAIVVEAEQGLTDQPVAEVEDEESRKFISDFLHQVDVEERQERAAAEPTPEEALMEANTEVPDALETPLPEAVESEASEEALETEATRTAPDKKPVDEVATVLGAVKSAPVVETAPAGSYTVDVEALLAISDRRVRRILARKAAAFVVSRRYTSSIGKFVREAGTIEDLLRAKGPVLTLPEGYEPTDSTDQGPDAASLVAFARGGEAAAVVSTPIPLPAPKRRGKAPAVKPAPFTEAVQVPEAAVAVDKPAEPDVALANAAPKADATPEKGPARKHSKKVAVSTMPFASLVSAAVAEAITPYLVEGGSRFRDGKEGLAASEYFARALEAEAALIRLSAFARIAKD